MPERRKTPPQLTPEQAKTMAAARAQAARRVIDDLADGERAVLLADVPGLPEIAERGGKKLNARVATRWALRGLNGVRLDTANGPSGRFTTRAAVRRFIAAMTGLPLESRGRNVRRKDQSAAKDTLAAAGFKV